MNCLRCGSLNSVTNGPPTAGTKTLNVEIVTGSLFKTTDINRFQKKQKNRSALARKNSLSRDCQSHGGVPPLVAILCFFQQLASVLRQVQVKEKKGKLTSQSDEMWSFVGYKGNKLWKELAIDALTKEILGL
jgi:hypothetical protein